MKDARQTAYEILLKVNTNTAYSNLTLDAALEVSSLDGRDVALVSALVYGTLERLLTIDYNLSLYLKNPVKKLEPEILTVLRLGTCQILFMNKIPESAAVNESVNLIKNMRYSYASSLVNAVLHKIVSNGLKLPDPVNDYNNYLSIKYSCPKWLVSLWQESYGKENAVGIMEASLIKPKTLIRVNTTKTSAAGLKTRLEKEGISAKHCDNMENALELDKPGSIEKLNAFKDGLFHVQDLASQICCESMHAKSNDIVFDLCSAPGGKAFTLGEIMKGEGRVMAFDIYKSRLELIQNSAQRLGLSNIYIAESDAGVYNEELGLADKVLCDVPCSGLGIIRRKPEIRYKSREDIDKLPHLQYFILCNASKYVKVGGLLFYSTCTLNPSENENVCDLFLESHTDFKARPVLPEMKNRSTNTDYLTLMPHINNSDGFFIASFCRTE